MKHNIPRSGHLTIDHHEPERSGIDIGPHKYMHPVVAFVVLAAYATVLTAIGALVWSAYTQGLDWTVNYVLLLFKLFIEIVPAVIDLLINQIGMAISDLARARHQ